MSDPPVIRFWRWIRWKNYDVPKKIAIWRAFLPKKTNFFLTSPQRTHGVYRWTHQVRFGGKELSGDRMDGIDSFATASCVFAVVDSASAGAAAGPPAPIPSPSRAFTAGEEASRAPPDPGHLPSQRTLVLALEPIAEEIRAASQDRRRNVVSAVVFVKLRSASRRRSPTAGENPVPTCPLRPYSLLRAAGCPTPPLDPYPAPMRLLVAAQPGLVQRRRPPG
jgi:hypothetical protein